MKTRLLTLTLFCAASLARADGMPGAIPADEAKPASAQMQAQSRTAASRQKLKRLPSGDLRQCLELGSNEAIIRCAEKPPKR